MLQRRRTSHPLTAGSTVPASTRRGHPGEEQEVLSLVTCTGPDVTHQWQPGPSPHAAGPRRRRTITNRTFCDYAEALVLKAQIHLYPDGPAALETELRVAKRRVLKADADTRVSSPAGKDLPLRQPEAPGPGARRGAGDRCTASASPRGVPRRCQGSPGWGQHVSVTLKKVSGAARARKLLGGVPHERREHDAAVDLEPRRLRAARADQVGLVPSGTDRTIGWSRAMTPRPSLEAEAACPADYHSEVAPHACVESHCRSQPRARHNCRSR